MVGFPKSGHILFKTFISIISSILNNGIYTTTYKYMLYLINFFVVKQN